jgi:hypothetical protein
VIRFTTLSAALFTEIDGFEFRRGQWIAVDVVSLPTEQREQLVKYTGRILGVHPDDEETFARFAAPEELEEPRKRPSSPAAPAPARDLDITLASAARGSSPSEWLAATAATVTDESASSEPSAADVAAGPSAGADSPKGKSKSKAKGEDREREQH